MKIIGDKLGEFFDRREKIQAMFVAGQAIAELRRRYRTEERAIDWREFVDAHFTMFGVNVYENALMLADRATAEEIGQYRDPALLFEAFKINLRRADAGKYLAKMRK